MAMIDLRRRCIGDSPVEQTATGNPVSFDTKIRAKIQQMLCTFTPTQESGSPSTSNVIPITGHTSINVYRTGKNIISLGTKSFTLFSLYVLSEPISPGTYTFSTSVTSSDTDDTTSHIAFFSTEDTSGTISAYNVNRGARSTVTVTLTKTCRSIALYAASNYTKSVGDTATFSDIQLELGSTATSFESFTGDTYTVAFPNNQGTIYGGSLNLTTGVLTVTHSSYIADANNGLITSITLSSDTGKIRAWLGLSQSSSSQGYRTLLCYPNPPLCNKLKFTDTDYSGHYTVSNGSVFDFGNATSYKNSVWYWLPYGGTDGVQGTTANDIKEYLGRNPMTFVGALQTPFTVQLTTVQISTLLGQNVIWSDTNGSNTVKYLKK